jgi:hypothetical protein
VARATKRTRVTSPKAGSLFAVNESVGLSSDGLMCDLCLRRFSGVRLGDAECGLPLLQWRCPEVVLVSYVDLPFKQSYQRACPPLQSHAA